MGHHEEETTVLQRKEKSFIYMLILCTFTGIIGSEGKVYAQSVAEQCSKPNVASDMISCLADRPCILQLRQTAKMLQVGWDGQKNYDIYNLRWEKSGKINSQSQIATEGGPGGIYKINNVQPCVTYSLKVRGCNKGATGN